MPVCPAAEVTPASIALQIHNTGENAQKEPVYETGLHIQTVHGEFF